MSATPVPAINANAVCRALVSVHAYSIHRDYIRMYMHMNMNMNFTWHLYLYM